jgi:hypothetical protein
MKNNFLKYKYQKIYEFKKYSNNNSLIQKNFNFLSNIVVNTSNIYSFTPNKVVLKEKFIVKIKKLENDVLKSNFKNFDFLLSAFHQEESLVFFKFLIFKKLANIGGPILSNILSTHILTSFPKTKKRIFLFLIC